MNRRPTSLTPVLVCLMLLVLDVSVAVSGDEWEIGDDLPPQDSEEIITSNEVPPLMCDGEICPVKDRAPYVSYTHLTLPTTR